MLHIVKSNILATVKVGRDLTKVSGCKCAENKEVRSMLVRLNLLNIAGAHNGKSDSQSPKELFAHAKEEDDKLFPILRKVASSLNDTEKATLNEQLDSLIKYHNDVIYPLVAKNKTLTSEQLKSHSELEDKIFRKYRKEILDIAIKENLLDQPIIGVSGVLDENTNSQIGSGLGLVLGAAGTGIALLFGAPILLAAIPFVLATGVSVTKAVSSPNKLGKSSSDKTSDKSVQDNLAAAQKEAEKAAQKYNESHDKFGSTLNDSFSMVSPIAGEIAEQVFNSVTSGWGPEKWNTEEKKNRAKQLFKRLYSAGFLLPYNDMYAGAEGWGDRIQSDIDQFNNNVSDVNREWWLRFVAWEYSNDKKNLPISLTNGGNQITTKYQDKLILDISEYTKIPYSKLAAKIDEISKNERGTLTDNYYRLQENRGKAFSVLLDNIRALQK